MSGGNIYGGPGTGGAERPLNVIVKNVVWAQLRDASGNEVGTATNPIYTTGTGSGGTTPVSGDVNVLDPCKGTQTNNIDVDVQSSALPAGAATAANQGTANTHLSNIHTDTQSIDGKITACNTGAIAGTVTANAGTNLNTSALALESGGVLDSIDSKITACNTGNVTIGAMPDVNVADFPDSVIDANNSTNTPLGVSATFTGTAVDVLPYAAITVVVYASHDSAISGLKIQFSQDGTNWDHTLHGTGYPYDATTKYAGTYSPKARYFRVTFTNGAVAQTAFRMQVILHAQPVTAQTPWNDHVYSQSFTPVGGVSTNNTMMPLTVSPISSDGIPGSYSSIFTGAFRLGFNGTTWDRVRIANAQFDIQGASGATVLSAVAGKKHRIFSLVLSADAAGLVTISDGIGRFYVAANTPVPINFGEQGIKQTTANTAITITNAGGGNVACVGTYCQDT